MPSMWLNLPEEPIKGVTFKLDLIISYASLLVNRRNEIEYERKKIAHSLSILCSGRLLICLCTLLVERKIIIIVLTQFHIESSLTYQRSWKNFLESMLLCKIRDFKVHKFSVGKVMNVKN